MDQSYLEVPKDTTYCEVTDEDEVNSSENKEKKASAENKEMTASSAEAGSGVSAGSAEEKIGDPSETPAESSSQVTENHSEVPAESKADKEGDHLEIPAEPTGLVTGDYSEVPTEPVGGDAKDYSEVPSISDGVTPEVIIPLAPAKKQFGPDAVGLVLSGGGGKGAYQIGVLRALSEGGVLKDVKAVAGTSIGAVNAVLFAQGDFDRAYKTWDDIDMDVLFDIDPAMLVSGRAIASREEMNRLMNTYVDYEFISKCELEIYCGVAEPLGEGRYRAEYMRLNGSSVGDIRKILMASTALPVIYDTVTIGGREYLDGGMADNEPIRPLYDAGIRRFIVIGLTAGRVFSCPQFSDAEFIVIDPVYDLGDVFSGTLNFHEQDKALKRLVGYKDGKRAIKTKFEKDEHAIAVERVLAKMDYDEAVRQVQHERTVAQLERDISSRFDYISQIEKKWGGD